MEVSGGRWERWARVHRKQRRGRREREERYDWGGKWEGATFSVLFLCATVYYLVLGENASERLHGRQAIKWLPRSLPAVCFAFFSFACRSFILQESGSERGTWPRSPQSLRLMETLVSINMKREWLIGQKASCNQNKCLITVSCVSSRPHHWWFKRTLIQEETDTYKLSQTSMNDDKQGCVTARFD